MNNIVISKAHTERLPSPVLHNMYRFRHEVFAEKLQWDVKSENGLEIDEYDQLDPIYILSIPQDTHVNGCWRLLPTTGSYMLKDTFPELLRGETAPIDKNVWELSRFAAQSDGREQAAACEVTVSLLQHIVTHALDNDIDEYVTVMSVAMERLLKSLGLPCQRFGDGKATRIGRVLSIAARFKMDQAFYHSVMALSTPMEKAA